MNLIHVIIENFIWIIFLMNCLFYQSFFSISFFIDEGFFFVFFFSIEFSRKTIQLAQQN